MFSIVNWILIEKLEFKRKIYIYVTITFIKDKKSILGKHNFNGICKSVPNVTGNDTVAA